MENPNLEEHTIRHFMSQHKHVDEMIEKMEKKIKKIKGAEQIEANRKILTQWRYIKWRIEQEKKKNWRIA